MTKFDLTGKVALITGASYGIGFAIAKAYAKAGATIVFNDIKQELVDKGIAAYAEEGIKAHGYVCDVTVSDLDILQHHRQHRFERFSRMEKDIRLINLLLQRHRQHVGEHRKTWKDRQYSWHPMLLTL